MAGVGTGGTITGVARYLKAQNPGVQIVGADPAGSVYSGGSGRPYLVEGIGEDFWPTTYDPSLVDRVVAGQRRGLLPHGPPGHPRGGPAHRRLGRHRGGRGARGRPRSSGPTTSSSCSIPDSGRGYLSRVFDDDWMAGYGFLRARRAHGRPTSSRPRRERHPAARLRPSRRHGARAVNVMRAYGVSQLPVAKGEMPLAAAEVLGAVDELALMDLAFRDPAVLDEPVEKVMGPPAADRSASASRSSWRSSCSTGRRRPGRARRRPPHGRC